MQFNQDVGMKISVLPLHLEPKTTALRKARNCPPSKGVVSKILFELIREYALKSNLFCCRHRRETKKARRRVLKKRLPNRWRGCAGRVENNLTATIFYRKCVWYIFILSVTVGLVKKIVLTFQSLGGNMKTK